MVMSQLCKLNTKASENVDRFHKTKLLLKIYRDVVWRVEDALYDVENTAYDLGGKNISELIEFLSFGIDEFDGEKDKKKIEEKLMSVAESKSMIEIIDKALIKLKSHPDNGEVYFNIINCNYITSGRMTDAQVQEHFDIPATTYYRYKRNAVNLLGVILWGYILPSLWNLWMIDKKEML